MVLYLDFVQLICSRSARSMRIINTDEGDGRRELKNTAQVKKNTFTHTKYRKMSEKGMNGVLIWNIADAEEQETMELT